jgi:hypothetical protein
MLDTALRNKEKTLALLDELAARIERGQLDAADGLVTDLMATASAGGELFSDLGLEPCA